MDSAGYVALSRQIGLMNELQVVANNLANISTPGFRREGVVFAEVLSGTEDSLGTLAMASGRVRFTDDQQGTLEKTGATFDLAVQGNGFLAVLTPQGERITRAGLFLRNSNGEIATAGGYQLLDTGGAPIFVPTETRNIAISADGTVSGDGNPLAQVGIFDVSDVTKLVREDGVLFRDESGLNPAEGSTLAQGFIESSNVEPVFEISRMIEVQRAYELGQNFIDREDERIRSVVRTLGPTR